MDAKSGGILHLQSFFGGEISILLFLPISKSVRLARKEKVVPIGTAFFFFLLRKAQDSTKNSPGIRYEYRGGHYKWKSDCGLALYDGLCHIFQHQLALLVVHIDRDLHQAVFGASLFQLGDGGFAA